LRCRRMRIYTRYSKFDFHSNSCSEGSSFPAENMEPVKAIKSKSKVKTPSGAKDKGKPDLNKSQAKRAHSTSSETTKKVLIRKDF